MKKAKYKKDRMYCPYCDSAEDDDGFVIRYDKDEEEITPRTLLCISCGCDFRG